MSHATNKLTILADLANAGPSTIRDIGARTGLTRVAVRNNLAAMARPAVGWVTRTPRPGRSGATWAITNTGRQHAKEPPMTDRHEPGGEDDNTVETARLAYRRGLEFHPPGTLDPETRERYALRKVLDQLIELGWQRPPKGTPTT